MTRNGLLTLDELRTAVQDGSVDTVLVAFTDMQGRLQGTRGAPRTGLLTLGERRTAVQDGWVDTVLVAFTDMQGRLQGKRCAAQYFLDQVVENAAEACNYLLAVDVEMN